MPHKFQSPFGDYFVGNPNIGTKGNRPASFQSPFGDYFVGNLISRHRIYKILFLVSVPFRGLFRRKPKLSKSTLLGVGEGFGPLRGLFRRKLVFPE